MMVNRAEVLSARSGGFIEYRIEGNSKEAVEEAIEQIERAYHPMGYGTSFEPVKQMTEVSWVSHGHRAVSCD